MTFSAGVTELGRSYGGDLSPSSLPAPGSIRLAYRQSRGRAGGGGGGRRDWELFQACLHLQKQGGRMTKGLGWIFSPLLKDTCVMLPPAATFADQRMSRKITVVCLPFSVALLFCSPASPHSCFLYYFISVSAALSLPAPSSISLFLFCITPSLPSLLLSPPPPSSHLCMCHFQLW